MFYHQIVHKQLAAHNVLLADGLTAKISGYGITDMQRAHEVKNSPTPHFKLTSKFGS
jgi:hypothetical protein